jgi:proteasome beta subunit
MTLVVAIICSDGVVIGAESASSDLEAGTKQAAEKLQQLGKHSVVYGGSGDYGLIMKLNEELIPLGNRPSLPKKVHQEIKRYVVPEMAEACKQHSPYPQAPYHQPPCAILLFAGVINKQPWILEIEKDGRDTYYGPPLGNFAAIGGGKTLAQALFRPHLNSNRDLRLGQIFTYRLLEDSIEISASGLAKPIYLYTISLDGAVKKIDGSELNQISQSCELWRQLERESVGSLLASLDKSGDEAVVTEITEVPTPGETEKKVEL